MKEEVEIDTELLNKEVKRRETKASKKERIESHPHYKWSVGIAKWLDKYYLDAILGCVLPAMGDMLTSIFVIPFITTSLFVVKSIPLTLAVVKNTLIDMMIGMIPFWIGNVSDIFYKSYKKNLRLIDGFVNDEKEIIDEVNRSAIITTIIIAVLIFIIYQLFRLAIYLAEQVVGLFSIIGDFFSSLF